MKPSVPRRLAIGLTALLIAGVSAFVVMEGIVRVVLDDGMNFNLEMWKYARDIKQVSADPLIGHEHRPRRSARLMGVDVSTNDEGYRDRDFPLARQPGVARVMMLGDSVVEGWGVPVQETVAKRLERAFAARGRTVEVINTGVGNYNTVMEVQAFLTRHVKYAPDLVVLNYTYNDAEPVPEYGSPGYFARNSEASVFLAGGIDGLLRQFGNRPRWDQYYLALYDTPGWTAARAALVKLAAYCRQQGIRLLIVSWPELHRIKPYPLQSITERVRAVAREQDVPFVDLLPAVADEEPSGLWVTPPDPHPNSHANALYAQHLFATVASLLPADGR